MQTWSLDIPPTTAAAAIPMTSSIQAVGFYRYGCSKAAIPSSVETKCTQTRSAEKDWYWFLFRSACWFPRLASFSTILPGISSSLSTFQSSLLSLSLCILSLPRVVPLPLVTPHYSMQKHTTTSRSSDIKHASPGCPSRLLRGTTWQKHHDLVREVWQKRKNAKKE